MAVDYKVRLAQGYCHIIEIRQGQCFAFVFGGGYLIPLTIQGA